MPDNKMLDGIRKINGQDLRKARETVLKSIGEKRKEVHAENSYQKLPKEDSGFNFEKNKKENILQPRKVDGISFGAQRKLKELIDAEERENAEAQKHSASPQNTKTRKHENTKTFIRRSFSGGGQKHSALPQSTKTLGFASKHENTKTRKQENKPKKKKKKSRTSFWQKLILRFGKQGGTKTRKHSASPQNTKTRKHEDAKTRRRENTKTRKHEDAKTRRRENTKTSRVKAVLRFFAYSILILTIYLILFYALFFMALVNFDFNSQAVRKASEYLRVPAIVAKIGIVEYYDYKDAADNFYYYNEDSLGINSLPEKKIKQELVKEIIINKIARKYSIQITAEEQEQEFNGIISGKSEDEIKSIMGAYYQLGAKRYIERVIGPKLLSEKTNQAILHDQEINYSAFSRAAKIKKALESGDDFYKIADEQGGGFADNRYYSYDEAISMFGDSAANMSAGQASDIIIVDNKYYIVYCFARRENSIGLRHIFVNAKSLDDYVQEEVSGLKAWSFVD
ncbi:hypothetical protein L6267_04595 [Candidatus Parcubacteria bacterium]|nr:hypothetical protein [Candidatus Parcubacteria bacterium]